MDISGLGSMYLDDYRSGGAASNNLANAAGGAEDFAAALKKAAASGKSGAAPQNSTGGAVIDKNSKLYEQCLELETFLVKTLVNSMRNTVQKSGLVDDGFAGKMYEDMLYDEYAKDFTRNANFGFAGQVYLELTGQRGKTAK